MLPTMRDNLDSLMRQARAASKNAIAPHSGIHVGCAILTKGNRLKASKIYTGWNIEGPWMTSIHAEVSAISRMAKPDLCCIDQIAIYAENVNFTPCGACLDWVMRFSNTSTLLYTNNGARSRSFLVKDMYPDYPKK